MDATARWVVLVHRPGPSLAPGESVFAHPAFREHVAFLERLRERGMLVAAGPLPDEPGTGMTVVRASSDLDIVQLANEDDGCVSGGYLTVAVREWDVRFTG